MLPHHDFKMTETHHGHQNGHYQRELGSRVRGKCPFLEAALVFLKTPGWIVSDLLSACWFVVARFAGMTKLTAEILPTG